MDSSRTPDRETTPDIHHYIADKLNGAIFSGWYTERVWIDNLQHYRDRIKVDEDEVQTNKILRSVSRRVKKLRPNFTGIDGESFWLIYNTHGIMILDGSIILVSQYNLLEKFSFLTPS